jgi:hypothetical protein
MILGTVAPLRNFRVDFIDVKQSVINEIMNAYLINSAIFLSFIFPLLCIAFYFGNFVTADEREKFCSEILALESADLEKFQRKLQRSHEQSPQQPISFQQPILGPDEIDVLLHCDLEVFRVVQELLSTEIMNLLETIVSAFDKKIEGFVSLDKIKIINGTYMAQAG